MIVGIAMMVVAVLGTIVAIALLGGSLDLDGLDREVVVTGSSEAIVPGEVDFKVIEDIDDPGATMNVGVVVDPLTGAVQNATRCRVTDAGEDEVELRTGVASDNYTSAREGAQDRPLVVAEDLRAGEYRARCEFSGEPVDMAGVEGRQVTFEVARVLTVDEVFAFARPAFGIVASVVVGGFVGLVGLILMIVGLVVGNRRNRSDAVPYGGGSPQGR